ncbi:MAG: chemotaxis protein CheX [Dehalococcoidia bacterium]|nr:chemotaxis protein CheX [Dehalococcoidia bacterium]
MKAALANPFLAAAIEVVEQETGIEVKRGDLTVRKSRMAGHDVTVLIAVTGAAEGVVLYGMAEDTAKGLVGAILGEPCEEFDEMAASGIAELGNVITGRASHLLEEAGLTSTISPPSIIRGSSTEVSTLDLPRLVIPLETFVGRIQIDVALREAEEASSELGTPPKPQVPGAG